MRSLAFRRTSTANTMLKMVSPAKFSPTATRAFSLSQAGRSDPNWWSTDFASPCSTASGTGERGASPSAGWRRAPQRGGGNFRRSSPTVGRRMNQEYSEGGVRQYTVSALLTNFFRTVQAASSRYHGRHLPSGWRGRGASQRYRYANS